jgi:hypothetical protein
MNFDHMQLDFEILRSVAKGRWWRLRNVTEEIMSRSQGVSEEDVEGRIDYLTNRRCFTMRFPMKAALLSPSQGAQILGSVFIKRGETIPDGDGELATFIYALHQGKKR